MFTIFRCILGDCGSAGGQGLIAHFAEGYGAFFYITYAFGMILTVFGFFNVITAIFVETCLEGLKNNEAQMQRAAQAREDFLVSRLQEFLVRIDEINGVIHETHLDRRKTKTFTGQMRATILGKGADVVQPTTLTTTEVSKTQFVRIMEDPNVVDTLAQLDIVLIRPAEVFEIFDKDENGLVEVQHMVATLLQMRGDVQKTDMIAARLMLDKLQKQVSYLSRAMGWQDDRQGRRSRANT